ncbi:semaphorin-5B-like [Bolinopsis microptera]|uniref:semaphorin-5B-like n=1 Tax=Bolinopsis microptera TaxID=2820187 RepID=UPI0030799545
MLVTLLVILALGLASAENTGKCKKMDKKITKTTKKLEKAKKSFEALCAVAIDGGWSDYSDWGACSAGCGKGTQTRSKTCNNPPPANGGKDCGGEAVESRECMDSATCSTGICAWGESYLCDTSTACSWSCRGGHCWRGCNGAACPHPDEGFCSDCTTWCWLSASGSVDEKATCSTDDDCIGILANPCVGEKGCDW